MSAVKSFPRDTSAAEMRQNRQVRRIRCDGAEACDCGVGCPTCKGLGHTFLGIDPGRGRRFRCVACRAEFLGPDMFTVINRGATDEHLVAFLCGLTKCSCRAGRFGRDCWAQGHVRDSRGRESARTGEAAVPLRGMEALRNLPAGPPQASRKRADGHYPATAGRLA